LWISNQRGRDSLRDIGFDNVVEGDITSPELLKNYP